MPSLSSIVPEHLLPLVTAGLIFCARICDVSVGTLRILFLSRGQRMLAPLLGFFESLIWLLAIRQIFENLTNAPAYLTYAAGFAAGTWVGMVIEERLAMGTLLVRIITREDASEMVRHLNERDFGVTSVTARGVSGRVRLVFSIVKRRELEEMMQIVRRFHPRAFVSVSDIRTASEGIFPVRRNHRWAWRRMGLRRAK